MGYTLLVNSTTADADEVVGNFEYIGAGSRLPMGLTVADDLTATTSVYDLGSATYKWRDAFFSGSVTCKGITNSGTSIFTGNVDMSSTCIISGTLTADSGIYTDNTSLKTKIVNIGDWDMDTFATNTVAHGLANYKQVRDIQVIIRNDTDDFYTKLDAFIDNVGTTTMQGVQGGVFKISTTNISLQRGDTITNLFDGTGFDSTSYNRGWIHIEYVS